MNTEIIASSLCEFAECPDHLDSEASFDQTTALKRRWLSLTMLRIEETLASAGTDIRRAPAVKEFLFNHPEIMPDELTYDGFADALVELVEDAVAIAQDVFVEGVN